MNIASLFSLDGKVAIVTGGTGVLGGALAHGLAAAGAKIGVLGRRTAQAEYVAASINNLGGQAIALTADVLNQTQLTTARDLVLEHWGRIDLLINAAGGNIPEANAVGERRFFDITAAALDQVIQLNLNGTIIPSQIFGEVIAQQGSGAIINISSMAARKPLTRVVGYAAAKAAVDNFTTWLAIELALKYGPGLRVNAIAPGFFVGDQNRALLLNSDNTLTSRGQQIIDHTPMRRFGEPDELIGTAIWLASDAARFVTGIVVPVDGGFSAYSGI
jgi:NAD(P)-dependent dehydrogenase (short-subunit alcohol dehydrogenase family)